MAVLKEFLCTDCGVFEETVDRNISHALCPRCAKNSERTFLTAPSLGGEIRTHFNAHYDEQIGQYFETAEQKKAFLKKTNREQISGHLSPRKTKGTSILCTKDQAKKLDRGSTKPLSGSTNEPL